MNNPTISGRSQSTSLAEDMQITQFRGNTSRSIREPANAEAAAALHKASSNTIPV